MRVFTFLPLLLLLLVLVLRLFLACVHGVVASRVTEPKTTVYRCGPLIDLCRGPHLRSTSQVKVRPALPRGGGGGGGGGLGRDKEEGVGGRGLR